MADCQLELDAAEIQRHQFLAGLLQQWTVPQIVAGCTAAIGFPYHMITSLSEAAKVAAYLESLAQGEQ